AAAQAAPGVVAVLTLADLAPHLTRQQMPIQFRNSKLPPHCTPYPLAKDEVAYVGQAVAVVIASSRYLAEDAAALVEVDYDILPAVSDCKRALAPDSPWARQGRSTNILAEIRQGYGEVDAAFASAPHRLKLGLKQHRGGAHSIEGRGVLAAYDAGEDRLTVWSSTQLAHELRSFLMELLDLDENRLRVVTPDVGGGFGAKFLMYPEEIVIPLAGRMLRRPIKWIEDRREHFLASIQERDQYWELEVAFDGAGRLLAVRGEMVHDQGAYTPQGINTAYNSSTAFPGPYVLPAYEIRALVVETNKVPTVPVRGAGYPQGCFAMERTLDRIAQALGLDRALVRERNLVPAAAMPYTTPLKSRSGSAIAYDTGDFPKSMNSVIEAIEYKTFIQRQNAARSSGRYLGIGIANGMKGTGRGPYESALVRVGRTGRVSVFTGAMPMGQGVKTALAQICAEQLGVAPEEIAVTAGDTATIPLGMGGFASRQTVTAGSSAHLAAASVRQKALGMAAHLLEAAVEDLEMRDGRIELRGVPGHGVTLREVASVLCGDPGYAIPGKFAPGLESYQTFAPDALTYGIGCHAAEVEVDIGTGAVRILRYIVATDCGRAVNPMMVEGQIHGGAAHGIGNALYEWMGFDEGAQPITTTFAEYLLATSTEMPKIEVRLLEYPASTNPLGVKGVGEAGCVPAAAAIISAVENALEPFGVRIDETPILPPRLLALIEAASKRA
ncbi:MAG TPA: xanthine dehydrogenase family protein molybdopterin-binding subunit, partial [Stellaceae bacterium]|nr:xanthine dehydrogenase family protein molybdopterin-binding subunit [Stellaceae bacterium]